MPSSTDARQIGPVSRGTTEEHQSRAEVVGTGTDCSNCSDRSDGNDPGGRSTPQLIRPALRGARPAQCALAASFEARRVFRLDGPSRAQPLARNWVLRDALSGAGKGLVH
jgi:hypothetical protein